MFPLLAQEYVFSPRPHICKALPRHLNSGSARSSPSNIYRQVPSSLNVVRHNFVSLVHESLTLNAQLKWRGHLIPHPHWMISMFFQSRLLVAFLWSIYQERVTELWQRTSRTLFEKLQRISFRKEKTLPQKCRVLGTRKAIWVTISRGKSCTWWLNWTEKYRF